MEWLHVITSTGFFLLYTRSSVRYIVCDKYHLWLLQRFPILSIKAVTVKFEYKGSDCEV